MIDLKGLFKNAVSGGLAKLGDSAKGIIEAVADGKLDKIQAMAQIEAEKNRHEEALIEKANDLDKAYLADVADSREMNARIQESDKASWLAKNIGYVIDMTVLFSFLAMLVMITFRVVPESNKELFYMAFGSLGTFAATSINWHRGSSQGSQNKQGMLDRMISKR